MAYAKLSASQINSLRSLRTLPDTLAKPLRATIFGAVKAAYDIPQEHKLKVEIDDTHASNYGVLVRKKDGALYPLDNDGRWPGCPVVGTPPAPPVEYRWFRVPFVELHTTADECYDWRDGHVQCPTPVLPEHSVAISATGELWAKVPSTAFSTFDDE